MWIWLWSSQWCDICCVPVCYSQSSCVRGDESTIPFLCYRQSLASVVKMNKCTNSLFNGWRVPSLRNMQRKFTSLWGFEATSGLDIGVILPTILAYYLPNWGGSCLVMIQVDPWIIY
jgi:hypothetical protein